MARSFQLISDFSRGYRAREESTKLSPSVLIYPSKNVVTNTAGRIQKVKGYALDGDASTVSDNGIQGWFDFTTRNGNRRNLRAGFLTNAANDAKMQFRYKDRTVTPNVVTWKTLISSLTNAKFSFTEFWDTTELVKVCLAVNGDGNVYEWNGAVATIASTTVNSITISGTPTAQQAGFYTVTAANMKIRVNGTVYTYTGITGNVFTGVTVDPTGEAVGSVLWQEPVTTAVATMSGTGFSTFKPDVIQKGIINCIYYGQSDLGTAGSNLVFISKVDNYKDVGYTSPVRVVGEGFLYTLDAPPRAFIPQETGTLESSTMTISAGTDFLYREIRTLDSTLTKEQLQLKQLRTGQRQAVFDKNSVARNKNGFCYLSNDAVINQLGQVSNQYVPELTDLSYSIIDDMVAYTFTGGATFYRRNYIYRSVPSLGIVRIYNMTDPGALYWESPVQYPVSGFYSTEDDEIGGHGYGSSESYLLFTGTRFRANPTDDGFAIPAYAFFAPYPHLTHLAGQRARFPNRSSTKATEELFIDGYMSANTSLIAGINLDLDGCVQTRMRVVSGSNTAITCPISEAGSLGSAPFGTEILGDGLIPPTRPPYFQVFETFDKYQYRFEQVFFYDEDIDTSWEIISFGTDSMSTAEIDTDVRQ